MYKENPSYTHYKKFDRMITRENKQGLINICLRIIDVEILKECYKNDEHLNNVPKNRKAIHETIDKRILTIEMSYKSKIKREENIDKIINLASELKKQVSELKRVKKGNTYMTQYSSSGQFYHFDINYNEVRQLSRYVCSLSDCVSILKRIMRYYILKVDRPKVFLTRGK